MIHLVRGGRQGEELAGMARWTLRASHNGGMAIASVVQREGGMIARPTPRITRSSRPSIEVSVETGASFTHQAPSQRREGPRRVDTVVGRL